jgi:hypothetical protein
LICDALYLAAILSSLKGLDIFSDQLPSVKTLGYFQENTDALRPKD